MVPIGRPAVLKMAWRPVPAEVPPGVRQVPQGRGLLHLLREPAARPAGGAAGRRVLDGLRELLDPGHDAVRGPGRA